MSIRQTLNMWWSRLLCTCVCSQVCFKVGAFEVCFPAVGMSADVIAGPWRDGSVWGRVVGWSGSDGGKRQTTWRRCGCWFRGQNHHDWSSGHEQHRAGARWDHLEDWERTSRHCSRGRWGMTVHVCVWRVPDHADRSRSRDPWPVRWPYLKKYNQCMNVIA